MPLKVCPDGHWYWRPHRDSALQLDTVPIPLFCFVLFCFLASSRGLWDLSSPTRDQALATGVKALSPNHWTTREFPVPIPICENTWFLGTEVAYMGIFSPECSYWRWH